MGNHCGPDHHRCRLETTIGLDNTLHFVSCPNHLTLCLNEVINSMSNDIECLEKIEILLRNKE